MEEKNQEDPNTISISVADEVKMTEAQGDTGKKGEPSIEEVRQAVLERKMVLVENYVEPHNKPARWITSEEDFARVRVDAPLMAEMCMVGRGDYTLGSALSHTQINDEDPLRFFVLLDTETNEWVAVINPVIFDAGGDVVTAEEGCLSYPSEPMKQVGRWESIRERFNLLGPTTDLKEWKDGFYLTERMRKNIYGYTARVHQHEIQHLNGHNIYDEDYSVTNCLGSPDEPEE